MTIDITKKIEWLEKRMELSDLERGYVGMMLRHVASETACKTALVNDKELCVLQAERVRVYTFAKPTVILGENGEAETVWLDETNHPQLSKINEMIKHRTEQIKGFYDLDDLDFDNHVKNEYNEMRYNFFDK
jgi:hypothetical protein